MQVSYLSSNKIDVNAKSATTFNSHTEFVLDSKVQIDLELFETFPTDKHELF